uniref:Adenosine deaminase domain-containing protein n=1 Tax=Amphimedon queenslandica TaxID=400682 RepID=A0A1X7SGF0_AMPQE
MRPELINDSVALDIMIRKTKNESKETKQKETPLTVYWPVEVSGLSCHNTDDKGVFNTTLSKEYFIAAKTFGLTEEEIEKISKDAMKYTFDFNDIKI